ncbi:hypothetical protein [Roseateles sp. BYS87W]|uniref:DUF5666 domain-containing protein n=1 Tax=Pelomonas baiyunensis TaxID=3299026 RepID=A0ABW7H4Y0_9BURK
MKTPQLLIAALLAACALGANPVMAHGSSAPRHGGIVQVANDVNFELVVEADGATLYLVDHDEDMPSKGISGKLTVLNGAQKTEVDLKATDGNKLRATGVKIEKGAKVVAVLQNVEGKTATVRFTVK